LELWAVRIPGGFSSKHLDGVSIQLPSTSRTGKLGTVARKGVTFIDQHVNHRDENSDFAVGGEEMKSFTCLLPRRRAKHQLYQAPKPIARHLIISQSLDIPTASPSDLEPSRRPTQQTDLLRHTFAPIGSQGRQGIAADSDSMDVDVPQPVQVDTAKAETKKKRKKDGETSSPTKKSKKVITH